MSRPATAILGFLSFIAVALSGCTGGSESSENLPPTAAFVITPGEGLKYTLDASASADPEGDVLSYGWNWVVDSLDTTAPTADIELPADAAHGAKFQVSLVVRDANGAAAFAIDAITVGSGSNAAPMATIATANRWVKPGDEVVLDAEAGGSHDMEGDSVTFTWFWGPNDGTFNPAPAHVEDPCAETSTDLANFNPGCLGQGESLNVTFDKPGVIYYHCHPHPWMKGWLVVDAAAPADPVTLAIRDFAFPEVTTVGVGATLTILNEDPLPHTVTAEHYTPGGAKVDGPLFQQALPEGDYIARLVATDSKGAQITNTYGLRASAAAPENPLVVPFAGETPQVQGQAAAESEPIDLEHKHALQAVLTWADVGGVPKGTVELWVDNDGTWAKVSQCASSQEGATSAMACIIPKGRYQLRVSASTGILHEWEVTFTAVPFATPGFGDSCGTSGGGHDSGAGGHEGHMAPPAAPGADADVRTEQPNQGDGHAHEHAAAPNC